MKPRTKFQKQIVNWSKKLPKITEPQKNWAYKNCFEHYAHRTKKGVTVCLECGEKWTIKDDTAKSCVCPHCGVKLKIDNTRKRVFKQADYITILTTNNGCQVFRFLYVYSEYKVGKPAYYFCKEVVQRWLAPSGKYATLALLSPIYGYYDTWQFSSDLELRPEKQRYNIYSLIYPHQKIIKEIKRNGFKGDYHSISPFSLFHSILTNSKMETLLKVEQYSLLKYFAIRITQIDKYWSSIKICIRNGYIVEDATMWYDYLDLLKSFKKDTLNFKYVCPNNLREKHDVMVEKRHKQWEEERKKQKILWEERKQEKMKEYRLKKVTEARDFRKMRRNFFDISFSDGQIMVRVLKTIKEFEEEGKAMHHCVFTNKYYLRSDSLILSATVGNKKVETVEVSLSNMVITQCYGACNQNTEYHERILKLVNKNMKLIQKRVSA